jgi:cytochrome c-type biogenesis protein CcmE
MAAASSNQQQKWKNTVAVAILLGGLAGLVALLVLPGLATRYVAVDELLAGKAEFTGRAVRLAGSLAARPELQADGGVALQLEARGQAVRVIYRGAVPPNLDPGRDVLADGKLGPDGLFRADRLYTRCSSREQAKLHPAAGGGTAAGAAPGER